MIAVEVQKHTIKSPKTDIAVLILNENKGYNLLNKPMIKWVLNALKDYTCVCADYKGEDVVKFAKQNGVACEYLVVIADKLPLLTPQVFNKLIDYCLFKSVNACKFSGGYVFKKVYLDKIDNIFVDSVYIQDEEFFYLVENKKMCSYAREVLQNRIIQHHINNGVEILNTKNVEIEPEVEIAEGVTIFKGNTLKGNTIIEKGVILKENNVIEDSFIGEDACVCNSTLVNSKIGAGTIIMPYCNIENSKIGKNCTIASGTVLNKQNIKK